MEDVYRQLCFKQPEFLENPYGIKIYVGTKGKSDWCVVIPKNLVKLRCPSYTFDNDYSVYMETEEHVLKLAELYTKLAENSIVSLTAENKNVILSGGFNND